jgi:hypothetical protein
MSKLKKENEPMNKKRILVALSLAVLAAPLTLASTHPVEALPIAKQGGTAKESPKARPAAHIVGKSTDGTAASDAAPPARKLGVSELRSAA